MSQTFSPAQSFSAHVTVSLNNFFFKNHITHTHTHRERERERERERVTLSSAHSPVYVSPEGDDCVPDPFLITTPSEVREHSPSNHNTQTDTF